MRSNETNYYMQTYLHLLTTRSLKRFGRYTQTVRYTLRERKFQGTKIPRSESSIELSFPGAKRPESERARERKFQGANWPGSYWPIRFGERIGPGAKRLGTLTLTVTVRVTLTLPTLLLDTVVNKAPTSAG